MAYTIEDIKKSQEIFYYLLENHELREEEEQMLYKAYTEVENLFFFRVSFYPFF